MELLIENIANWCNHNSGLLTAIIFILTIFIGWISGFFKMIRKRPIFKIRTIEGATFYSTIFLDKTYQDLPVHKTAFVLYLEISNTGNAPSSIGQMKIGYFPDNNTPIWRAKRNWIHETVLKSQLTSKFRGSELVKGYPFLKQKSNMSTDSTETFMDIGRIANGIAYFEEREAFGNWIPKLNKDNETTNVKIVIQDAFGRKHTQKIDIIRFEPSKALEMSPYFGQTYEEYFISHNNTEKNEGDNKSPATDIS